MTSQHTSSAHPTGIDMQGGVAARVTSADGTPIAYWRSGRGPALMLVHGTSADHTRWQDVLPRLRPRVAAYAMDRRGRGGSGDTPAYTLASEAADVAAVVDAIADSTAGPVDVLGHSYGATCALEAALLTPDMRRLVLYESGAGTYPIPSGLIDRMTALLADDQRAEVVTLVMRDLAGMTEDQLALAKAAPSWPNRVAAAHTVVRELRAHDAYTFDPARFAAWTVPTPAAGRLQEPSRGGRLHRPARLHLARCPRRHSPRSRSRRHAHRPRPVHGGGPHLPPRRPRTVTGRAWMARGIPRDPPVKSWPSRSGSRTGS